MECADFNLSMDPTLEASELVSELRCLVVGVLKLALIGFLVFWVEALVELVVLLSWQNSSNEDADEPISEYCCLKRSGDDVDGVVVPFLFVGSPPSLYAADDRLGRHTVALLPTASNPLPERDIDRSRV